VRRIQPAFFTGEEKRWWEYSVREATPMFLQSGFMDAAQLDGLLKALEVVALDPEVMVAQPVMTQVRARRKPDGQGAGAAFFKMDVLP